MRTRSRVGTVATAALALVLALIAIAVSRGGETERRRLLELYAAAELGPGYEEAREDIRREVDPARARNRLARALLAYELESGAPASDERGLENLARARELATQTLETRPVSWQAAMILGSATHLERSRRLEPERDGWWQKPLELAHRLAPVEPEPPRFLAAALLGRWSTLSPEARRDATEWISRALENGKSFDLLIDRWSSVAPSFDAVLETMPTDPSAWSKLETRLRDRGDRERQCRARVGGLAVLRQDLERRLDRAELELRHRRREPAVQSLISISRDLALEQSFGPLADRLLALMPAARLAELENFATRWREWAEELCRLERCPLEPAGLAGLRQALAAGASPLPSSKRDGWLVRGATVSLALEEPTRAAEIELEILSVPEAPAAVEVLVDGRLAGCRAVRPNTTLKQSTGASEPWRHLEIRNLATWPIEARLRAPGLG